MTAAITTASVHRRGPARLSRIVRRRDNRSPGIHEQQSNLAELCSAGQPSAAVPTQSYWLTPLARKPPSTASTWPVTKLAASDARKTAAPPSSSSFPNLFIGVRSKKFAAAIGSVQQGGVQIGAKDAGSDRIHTNPRLGPFDGQRLRQRSDRRLAGAVCGNFIERDERG